jgi:hypothetical protein
LFQFIKQKLEEDGDFIAALKFSSLISQKNGLQTKVLDYYLKIVYKKSLVATVGAQHKAFFFLKNIF